MIPTAADRPAKQKEIERVREMLKKARESLGIAASQ